MELVHYPHPALLEPVREIVPGQEEDLLDKIREMFQVMDFHKGVGLAGPQVAWSVRLFIANPTGEKKDELVFINPKITKLEGTQNGEEGCLSFPGIFAKVQRAQAIEVEYLNEELEPRHLRCSDLLARIVQHESDHLENVLLVHRMSVTDKFVNRRKLKELKEAMPT